MRETLRVYVPESFVRIWTLRVKSKRDKYREIEKALLQARLPLTLQRFIAISRFYSLISFFIGSILGIALFYILSPSFILFITSRTPFYSFVIAHYPIISKIFPLFGVVIGLILYKLVSYLILSYPFLVSSRRKSEIDLYILDAVNMMYGMSIGGLPAYNLIKTIAESKHIFGELSREFMIIVEMVEVFKKDLYEAMKFVRDTTPSEKLSGFLDGFVYILQGGGNVTDFLKGKSETYTEEREVAFESFIEFMGVFAEIYLALFVLLPLFLLIILVVMKLVGQDVLILYRNALFVILPVSAVMLSWLIRSSIPAHRVMVEKVKEGRGTPLKANVTDAFRDTFTINRYKRIKNKLKRFVLHPFTENIYSLQIRFVIPHLVLIAAIFFALLYNRVSIELATLIPLSVVLLPLITLIEIKERIIRKAEERIPDMFSELAMLNEAGLTIFEGLNILTKTEMGILTKEIETMRRELEWGALIPRAFMRLGLRLKSEILAKVIPVVVRSLEVTPTIKDAFNIVASYAETEVRFRNRLRSSMFLYVIIIYMSIGVFLFISYVVVKNFLSSFSGIGATEFGGISVGIDVEVTKELFFQITLLVSILSGIIAGVIGECKAVLGIKHAYIFAVLTYIVFYYII